ncbi:MAG: DNA translocase FtsK 4TM domain-containing protein [Alistipes sp.]
MNSQTNTTKTKQIIERSAADNARWIFGLILILLGAFATASVISYFSDWKTDFSIIQGLTIEDPRVADSVDNLGGFAGAWLAEQIIGRSFGVFGLILPLMVMVIALQIFYHRPFLFNHSTLSALIILILGSLTLGFCFGERFEIFNSGWGGAYGIEISAALERSIGSVGTSILLLGGWILTGVFINRNFINTVNRAGQVVFDGGGKILASVSQKVNGAGEKNSQEVAPQEIVEEGAVDAVAEPILDQENENQENQEDELTEAQAANMDENPFLEISTAATMDPETLEATPTPTPLHVSADGVFTEVDLSPAAEMEACAPVSETNVDSGLVVTVEAHQAKILDEKEIVRTLYDPLKDLEYYVKPSPGLLENHPTDSMVTKTEIADNIAKIQSTLRNFGIEIQNIHAASGPTVTLYEIVQAEGIKISKIQGLENDIAQSLKALGIRIIAPIPGRGTIGIEVPNINKQIVSMYSSICSPEFQNFKAELPVVIGRTIQNVNYVFDLTKMPHLLVAGATGQGKSVGLNAIITSLLYSKHPAQLKFVMIDPKMVEFSLYSKIEKHFLAKMESEEEAIVTDPKKAIYTLNALCTEMDTRLDLCRRAGARNIAEYNEKFINRRLLPTKGHRFMPYIVVVIDEFADLIMTAKEVEGPVMRLAQKARAIGIHLIVATQRPDVKVITGGIKANFPARIAFRVMQMIDSRTIIDQPGANQLIGRGDMLLSKDGELTRIQCALVDTPEVERVVDYIAKQQGYTAAYPLPDYTPESSAEAVGLGSEEGKAMKYDALFADIARAAVSQGQISTSSIQRNYEVGFNRAGRIMMQLQRSGIVGPQEGAKPRDILYHDLPSLEARLQDLGVF